ncbi:MAG TPA: ABC transporter permease [Prolixibacteraceae bacterium]|nr:ABC transporter permease [Prolixibacteraceae bacterium]
MNAWIHFSDVKQIVRSLSRKKLLTVINILGLGIGLGTVILLTTFLLHEFSYDRFHTKTDRIYRVIEGKRCTSYYAMGEAFKESIPEIEDVCRIANVSDIYTVILSRNNENYPIMSFMAVDASLFNMLDIEMVLGPPKPNFFGPGNLLISDRMARQFFGSANPLGETLEFFIANEKEAMHVSGVFKHLPSYSSFQADFICDISVEMAQFRDLEYSLGLETEKQTYDFQNDWSRHNDFTTFVLLNKKSNVAAIEKKCTEVFLQHREDIKDGGIFLQPYTDMYLHSAGLENIHSLEVSKFSSLRIFLSIGILILLVACLNFILISSAEQEQSLTEIACRKVNGASGKQLVTIILLKSFLISFASLVPAFLFTQLSLPLFNNYFGKELEFGLFFNGRYLVSLLLITASTAILAGTCLSIAAIKTSPANLFQKSIKTRGKKTIQKSSLIVAQFFVFILLFICTMVMQQQMNYSMKKDMGFKTENTLVINLATETIKKQYLSLINEIKKLPRVVECQPTTYFLPPNDNILFASFKDPLSGKSIEQEAIFLAYGNTDLLQIPVVEGISFSESTANSMENILINEAAAKKYDVKAGEKLFHFNILGIVNDFHNKSVHEAIRPLFIIPQSTGFTNLLIKTNGENTIVSEEIERIIKKREPGFFYEDELLTDRIAAFYKNDLQQAKIIRFFSGIALVLAFMGLFGFVTLSLTQKIKEIGIRKINGATIAEIVFMLNKDFVKWVAIAFVIATPIAYYAMHKWLENFAYKTSLSWWIFALAGILALGIALLTVSWQSWRAATRNPVVALRYE